MMKKALGLPNGALIGDDLDRISALGVVDLLDLHYFADRWPDLVRRGFRVHARMDWRGSLGDPMETARAFVGFARSHPYIATWRAYNEPQIECHGITLAAWREWLTAFLRAAKQSAPDFAIFAPAVSPGTPDRDDWIAATAHAASAAGADGIDVHAYGWPQEIEAVLRVARSVWHGRVLVTETNFGAGRAVNLDAYARTIPAVFSTFERYGVEAAFWFIWRWNHPDLSLPTPVDMAGTAIETAWKTLTNEEESMAEVLDKGKLKAYSEWAGARLANNEDPRDVAAFIEHLRRLGADWRHPTDYGLPYVEVRPLAS